MYATDVCDHVVAFRGQHKDKLWKDYLEGQKIAALTDDTPQRHEHLQQVETLLAREPLTTAVPKNDGRPGPY